jgi:hypothetical protein
VRVSKASVAYCIHRAPITWCKGQRYALRTWYTGIRTHIYQPTYTLVRSTYVALQSRSRSSPFFGPGLGPAPKKNPVCNPSFYSYTFVLLLRMHIPTYCPHISLLQNAILNPHVARMPQQCTPLRYNICPYHT